MIDIVISTHSEKKLFKDCLAHGPACARSRRLLVEPAELVTRWSARPRVRTSARRVTRALGDFVDALIQAVAQRLQGLVPAAA